MKILVNNENGMTVRELRHIIGQFEETDADGNDAVVYIAVGNLHMSVGVAVAMDDDGDMVLVPDHAKAVMEDLETWNEFIA